MPGRGYHRASFSAPCMQTLLCEPDRNSDHADDPTIVSEYAYAELWMKASAEEVDQAFWFLARAFVQGLFDVKGHCMQRGLQS